MSLSWKGDRENFLDMQEKTDFLESLHYRLLVTHHGEGDGTPLQYSCLENPMDGGAW